MGGKHNLHHICRKSVRVWLGIFRRRGPVTGADCVDISGKEDEADAPRAFGSLAVAPETGSLSLRADAALRMIFFWAIAVEFAVAFIAFYARA
jgi:hypothetical protein